MRTNGSRCFRVAEVNIVGKLFALRLFIAFNLSICLQTTVSEMYPAATLYAFIGIETFTQITLFRAVRQTEFQFEEGGDAIEKFLVK